MDGGDTVDKSRTSGLSHASNPGYRGSRNAHLDSLPPLMFCELRAQRPSALSPMFQILTWTCPYAESMAANLCRLLPTSSSTINQNT